VKLVRSASRRERHVPDLRKLRVIIERGDLQFRDPFRRRIRICPRSAIEDIRFTTLSVFSSMLCNVIRECRFLC
jgi:hypothetical protein